VILAIVLALNATGPLKIATVAAEGSPWAMALQTMKNSLEPELTVKVFAGGALGDEIETVQAVKRGHIQAFAGSAGALASLVPELNVLELPYLFSTAEDADHAIDVSAHLLFDRAFESRGFSVCAWGENGFRSFGTKNAIHSPRDLKGARMRAQENPIHVALYRAFGASPVPIPVTEALTAIQSGVVDGFDQSPLVTFASKWYSAISHYTLTEHIYQAGLVVVNKAYRDALPASAKVALVRECIKLQAPLRNEIRALTPVLLEKMRKAHVEVHVLTTEEKRVFQTLGKNVRNEWRKSANTREVTVLETIEGGPR
jgi:TRAP-type transport system periplasmic protein